MLDAFNQDLILVEVGRPCRDAVLHRGSYNTFVEVRQYIFVLELNRPVYKPKHIALALLYAVVH